MTQLRVAALLVAEGCRPPWEVVELSGHDAWESQTEWEVLAASGSDTPQVSYHDRTVTTAYAHTPLSSPARVPEVAACLLQSNWRSIAETLLHSRSLPFEVGDAPESSQAADKKKVPPVPEVALSLSS